MANISKNEIFKRFLIGLGTGGYNYTVVKRNHPFKVRLLYEDNVVLLKVYCWNLTHGGGEKRPIDEYRIQITGVGEFIKENREIVLILGWRDEMGVFSAFDFNYHIGRLGYSPSIQVKENALIEASLNGFSFSTKTTGETVYTFTPAFVMSYIYILYYQVDIGIDDKDKARVISAIKKDSEKESFDEAPEERKHETVTLRRAYRKPSFREKVLQAYNRECAVCGLQLELVEASHIIPVSHPRSNDSIKNGLCLCRNHHKAYDDGLILIFDDFKIDINEDRINYLRAEGLDGELDRFLENKRDVLLVPLNEELWPSKDYLRIGFDIRRG
jgi:putative restriction endonuclease